MAKIYAKTNSWLSLFILVEHSNLKLKWYFRLLLPVSYNSLLESILLNTLEIIGGLNTYYLPTPPGIVLIS